MAVARVKTDNVFMRFIIILTGGFIGTIQAFRYFIPKYYSL